jgi:hypothetical protein
MLKLIAATAIAILMQEPQGYVSGHKLYTMLAWYNLITCILVVVSPQYHDEPTTD